MALGFLVYFLYQYAEYAMFWAVGPLYPLHVLLPALSLSATAILVGGLDLAHAAGRFSPRFPRRAVAGLGVFMVLVLCGLWLPTIWKVVVGGDFPANLNGGVTLVIPALDLGFLVPLGVFTAVATWRRLPAGYVLATTVVVKATTMAAAIATMLVVEWLTTGVLEIVPIALFGLTALGSAAIGYRVYGSIAEAPGRMRPGWRPPRAPLAWARSARSPALEEQRAGSPRSHGVSSTGAGADGSTMTFMAISTSRGPERRREAMPGYQTGDDDAIETAVTLT